MMIPTAMLMLNLTFFHEANVLLYEKGIMFYIVNNRPVGAGGGGANNCQTVVCFLYNSVLSVIITRYPCFMSFLSKIFHRYGI